MAKHGNYNFFQVPHKAIETCVEAGLPATTCWTYLILLKLENRLTNGNKEWFYRSYNDLALDTGLSRASVFRGVVMLKALKIIDTRQVFFTNDKSPTGRSRKHVTYYRINR